MSSWPPRTPLDPEPLPDEPETPSPYVSGDDADEPPTGDTAEGDAADRVHTGATDEADAPAFLDAPGGDAPDEPAGRPSRTTTFLVGALVGALVGGAAGAGVALLADDDPTPATSTVPASLPPLEDGASISEIAAAVGPSVVSIQTQTVGLDSVLQPFAQEGAGSGFIVSPDGLIITNNHVIDGARTITVSTSDGRELTATVLGRDPSRDLAVLDVDAAKLTPLPLGDSDALAVGNPVVAIGNALGLGDTPTVTSGIVSAKERTISVGQGVTLEHLLQTDAAINPGNSGGPLVNTAGQVVGINTAIAGGAENIGFAIAINAVKDVIEQLQTGEIPRTPFLGVQAVTVDEDLAARFDLGVDRGALVIEVTAGSGAELAGIARGDVILSIDGRRVDGAEDLGEIISDLEPGAVVPIEVDRGGRASTVEATIGERAGSLG